MDANQRKAFEKDIYDQKINQERPSYSSYWDQELFRLMYAYEFDGDLQRINDRVHGKKTLVLGASLKDVEKVNEWTDDITALNISQLEIDTIKVTFPTIKSIVADAESLGDYGEKFEVIYCHSILHHLHPFAKVIETLSHLLSPGGFLFISCEPGLWNPFAVMARRFAPSSEHTPGEKPFVFSDYNRKLQKYFHVRFCNYYFVFSMLIPFLAKRAAFFKPPLKAMLPLILWLENMIRRMGFFNNFYWITMGLYQRID